MNFINTLYSDLTISFIFLLRNLRRHESLIYSLTEKIFHAFKLLCKIQCKIEVCNVRKM